MSKYKIKYNFYCVLLTNDKVHITETDFVISHCDQGTNCCIIQLKCYLLVLSVCFSRAYSHKLTKLQVFILHLQYVQSVGLKPTHSHSSKHNTHSTTLLSADSARSNDRVGLVGVRHLIYLHANINTRGIDSPAGRNGCCAGYLLPF